MAERKFEDHVVPALEFAYAGTSPAYLLYNMVSEFNLLILGECFD